MRIKKLLEQFSFYTVITSCALTIFLDYSTAKERTWKETLPFLKPKQQVYVVSNRSVYVEFELSPGWEINAKAPSWMALFVNKDGKSESNIAEFNTESLRKLRLTLPTLKANSNYWLQGTFYFCKKQEGASCSVQSHMVQLSTQDPKKATDQVLISLH